MSFLHRTLGLRQSTSNSNATRDPTSTSEIFPQIAIVKATVSILSKSRPLFYFSPVLAVIGTTLTVNGYTLLFQLPWLHGDH